MKTLIVTVSSGQLGEVISDKLLDDGNQVIGVDLENNLFLNNRKNFIFRKLDITSQFEVQKFFLEIKKEYDKDYY